MKAQAIVFCVFAASACASSPNESATTVTSSSVQLAAAGRVDDAASIVHGLSDAVPESVLQSARCVIAVPSLVGGGFIVGAEHGRGFASCRTASGWSAPAPVTVSGGTFGPQVGVESADVLMLVMTDDAKNKLLQNQLDVGGDISAAAGPVGKGAGEDFNHHAAMLTYSRSRGLYAGVDLTGVVLHQDDESTRALYGGNVLPAQSLLTGQVGAPAATRPFISAVSSVFR
jgi:lipid-binding SYLF domain-containing protein